MLKFFTGKIKKTPKVSVIMPSYNHDRFVGEAVESVLSQSFEDFELIIVDDGSTDGTVNEIRKFKDKRINLICFGKNMGANIAAHKCLNESKGEYIAVLNSDDAFLPEKLTKQVSFLDNNKDVGATFGLPRLIDEAGNNFIDKSHILTQVFCRENLATHQFLNRFFYKGNCLCHSTALIRRECFQNIGSYDSRLAQLPDFDMWIRICLNYNIFLTLEDMARYRVPSDNTSASFNTNSHVRILWERAIVRQRYCAINTTEQFRKIFPEAEEMFKMELYSQYIPFYLGYLAWKSGEPRIVKFAVEALYKGMEDHKIAKGIELLYGFTYSDLIRISSEANIFGIS